MTETILSDAKAIKLPDFLTVILLLSLFAFGLDDGFRFGDDFDTLDYRKSPSAI